jgi:hypothetical protein
MDTLDSLMKKGYRIYNVKMKLTQTVRDYFKSRMGLLVDYHEDLKVITVRDAKSKSEL